jgi:hypothetical protein
MVYAIRLAGHEAYGFHSTAIIDDGCLRYRLLVQILVIVCISEALLKLEQPKNAKLATRNCPCAVYKAHLGGRC